MKTYLLTLVIMIVVLLFLSGCSTVSEYQQGCLEGLKLVNSDLFENKGTWEKFKVEYCNSLDDARMHRADKERLRPGITR